MKKDGFTLIELLAVIVILAITAVIVTPMIIVLIERTQKDAFQRSVELVEKATSININDKIFQKEYIYTLTDGVISDDVKVTNTEGMHGNIKYDEDGNVVYAIHNDKWCAIKTESGILTKKYVRGKCSLPGTLFNIEYILNGGTNPENAVNKYTSETETFNLPIPTKEGYTFLGWYTNEESTGKVETKIEKGTEENKVYYAKWEVITYTITYNLDGGSASNIENYTIETETFNLKNPTREGSEFVGWTGSNGTEPSTNVTISKGSMGDKEYNANYIITCTNTLEYTYTGESSGLIDDGDGNWRIKFLGSGTFTLTAPLCSKIDAFLVGGGGGAGSSSYPSAGGGGGGGYTQTIVVEPEVGKKYEIIIGAGGKAGENGDTTKAFGYSVLGGRTSYGGVGGNGGSGGGSHLNYGGSDGANGSGNSSYAGGEGQECSTREFGESNGTIYSGGGAGFINWDVVNNGTDNTGIGGSAYGGSGYSGIVVIRNHREIKSSIKYEYTGDSFFIDDGDGNWRIKFLSNGIFTPLEDMEIDAFLVGGGGGAGSSSYPSAGGGGGGGFTSTNTTTLTANEEYEIVIGAGGNVGKSGGTTTGFTFEALGGKPGASGGGGDGGSGGGGHGKDGGSDGANGSGNSSYAGGEGQECSTREFGESNGTIYSGGGAGYSGSAGTGNGKDNTGGGGSAYGGSGYSGIVVIRNVR